jgi:hypothetical protein
MFTKVKYVVTHDNNIIVFSEAMQHSEFKHFNPVSAGFISFGVNKQGNPTCSCYGKSVTLGISSRPAEDTDLAKRRLNMLDEY